MTANDNNPPAGDLLLGAPRIADFLGIRPRQVYRLIDDGELPAFKIGGAVSARRSTLNAWLAEQEAAARRSAV